MSITLREIRNRAIKFAFDWKDESNEQAEAQSFWTELFAVYGIKRRSVAIFEEKVRNLRGSLDRIDVFYSGIMLGEHKSQGESLTKAKSQAFGYVENLIRDNRQNEVPRYIVLSDFKRIVIYDLEKDTHESMSEFDTANLPDHVRELSFLGGQASSKTDPEDPINIRAVELLGELHNALESGGYSGHDLERFLVRILFMLFADDTGIFIQDSVKELVNSTQKNGLELGPLLHKLFEVLDTPEEERPAGLHEEFSELPYVNGKLFTERLRVPDFDKDGREALIEACEFNWSRISPAVFGSLFQSIMCTEEGSQRRRQIGAHYTSERDIMKLIRSLFLDDLETEFNACGTSKRKLLSFQKKLASLRFLDPACGCGNFLVVTYRELRRLELEVLKLLYGDQYDSVRLFADSLIKIDVDQMYGIEIEEWPVRIAEVAMWLVDHQMNTLASEAFGQPVLRLPLQKSAKIHHGNALRIDWNDVLPTSDCSFVLGNPPFVGRQLQTPDQKADQKSIWHDTRGAAALDYVTCWYRKAADYIVDTEIQCAFVSTNSISQGEQPGIFWPKLFSLGLVINFGHRTFRWESEARGRAHVHVVIIGFSMISTRTFLWEYDDADGGRGRCTSVSQISPYLFEGSLETLRNKSRPICDVPEMAFGNMPNDGGNLLLDDDEKAELLSTCPEAKQFIHELISADQFLNGEKRWCLWLVDAPPSDLRSLSPVRERVSAVKAQRELSSRETTRELARYPMLFGEIRQPDSRYVLVPRHSSESRNYIPLAFFEPEIIVSDSCVFVGNAQPYHFGVLHSAMHMAWVRQFCGRIKSDYRYSIRLVYNNFPWPLDPTDTQRSRVEEATSVVLDARNATSDQTLADLYDPIAMPKILRDAHSELDNAVDRCYRRNAFGIESARIKYLFELYQTISAPLAKTNKTRRRKVK